MSPDTYLQFVLALVFVLALIVALAWVARRFGLLGPGLPGQMGKRRTGVVEMTAIDAKRRLVLVRRDGREHLLLLGPGSDTVIETGIVPPPAPVEAPSGGAP
ncbi:MAG: flagellar biosynthetic protein FliO [Alphaproteobacteria bacterium]